MSQTHIGVQHEDSSEAYIEILTGIENYDIWFNQMRDVAEHLGLLTLIEGAEKLLPRPNKHHYTQCFCRRVKQVQTLSADADRSCFHSGEADLYNDEELIESLTIAQFEQDLREYDAQSRRVHSAVMLLYYSISHTIRPLTRGCVSPMVAYDLIRMEFEPGYCPRQFAPSTQAQDNVANVTRDCFAPPSSSSAAPPQQLPVVQHSAPAAKSDGFGDFLDRLETYEQTHGPP